MDMQGAGVLLETKVDGKESPAPRTRRVTRQPWHAVTIAAPANACEAAQACNGKRFLSSEAPWLPLEGCDVKRCNCRYRHYEDRRGDSRRQGEKSAGAAAKESSNRRRSRGRRTTD
jgi:hypothetical protein